MAKSNNKQAPSASKTNDRPNQKAFKKHPKKFDPIKRKLVNA